MSFFVKCNKSFHFVIWLTSLMTFYLGFNQQVMCFELNPDRKVTKVHLQLIECNPLTTSVISANYLHGKSMTDVMSSNQKSRGCSGCKDFHLSFKKNRLLNYKVLLNWVSLTYFDFPNLRNALFQNAWINRGQIGKFSQKTEHNPDSSLKVLRSIILLI